MPTIVFDRNHGTKSHESITRFEIEAEDYSEAVNIIQQDVLTQHPGAEITVGKDRLYISWTSKDEDYFDHYFQTNLI